MNDAPQLVWVRDWEDCYQSWDLEARFADGVRLQVGTVIALPVSHPSSDPADFTRIGLSLHLAPQVSESEHETAEEAVAACQACFPSSWAVPALPWIVGRFSHSLRTSVYGRSWELAGRGPAFEPLWANHSYTDAGFRVIRLRT